MTKSVESNGGACRRQGCGGQAEENGKERREVGLKSTVLQKRWVYHSLRSALVLLVPAARPLQEVERGLTICDSLGFQ